MSKNTCKRCKKLNTDMSMTIFGCRLIFWWVFQTVLFWTVILRAFFILFCFVFIYSLKKKKNQTVISSEWGLFPMVISPTRKSMVYGNLGKTNKQKTNKQTNTQTNKETKKQTKQNKNNLSEKLYLSEYIIFWTKERTFELTCVLEKWLFGIKIFWKNYLSE